MRVSTNRAVALRQTEDVPDHLLAHLSPLGWEHINLTGGLRLSRHSRDGQRKGCLPGLMGTSRDGEAHNSFVVQLSGTCLGRATGGVGNNNEFRPLRTSPEAFRKAA